MSFARTASALALTALTGVLALSAESRAATIIQLDPDASLAEATWSATTFSDHVELDLTKDFESSLMLGSPIILQITLGASDAGKDIWIVHGAGGEEVTNNTGVPFTGFNMYVVNVPSVLPQYAGATFTNLGGITSDAFSTVNATTSEIDFSNGTVVNGGTAHFSGIQIQYTGGDGAVFDLKEVPVPEPATLVVLGLGGLILSLRRR